MEFNAAENFIFYRNFRPPNKKYKKYFIDASIFEKPKYLIHNAPTMKIKFLEQELQNLANYLEIDKIELINQCAESYDMFLAIGENSLLAHNAINIEHEHNIKYEGNLGTFSSFFETLTYTNCVFTPTTKTQKDLSQNIQEFIAGSIESYPVDRTKISHLTSGFSKYNAIGVILFSELLTLFSGYKNTEFYRQVCWIAYCKLKTPKLIKISDEPIMSNETVFLKWATGELHEKSIVERYLNQNMKKLLQGENVSNRFRLMAVHYLVSELNIDWRYGEAHFYYYLIDGHNLINYYNWYWQVYRNRFRINYNLLRQCIIHGD